MVGDLEPGQSVQSVRIFRTGAPGHLGSLSRASAAVRCGSSGVHSAGDAPGLVARRAAGALQVLATGARAQCGVLDRWRADFCAEVKEGSESLLGEERFEVDQPSRLRVQLTRPPKNSIDVK